MNGAASLGCGKWISCNGLVMPEFPRPLDRVKGCFVAYCERCRLSHSREAPERETPATMVWLSARLACSRILVGPGNQGRDRYSCGAVAMISQIHARTLFTARDQNHLRGVIS